MSSSLFWRVVPKEPEDSHLGYSLKFYIAKRLWGHDGSLNGEWVTFASDDWRQYLQGLHDATRDNDLREDIDRVFKLWEEHEGVIEVELAD